jgi:hypothetical protein
MVVPCFVAGPRIHCQKVCHQGLQLGVAAFLELAARVGCRGREDNGLAAHRGALGVAAAGVRHAVGIGQVGFDVQNRCSVDQVNPFQVQPYRLFLKLYRSELDHGLTDGIWAKSGPGGEHPYPPVTAQTRWPDSGFPLPVRALVEDEEDPDVGEPFQTSKSLLLPKLRAKFPPAPLLPARGRVDAACRTFP